MKTFIVTSILLVLAGVAPVRAQSPCTFLQLQRHSLAMTLLLARTDLRNTFEQSTSQTDAAVKATILSMVCSDVWNSFYTQYKSLSPANKTNFDNTFTALNQIIGQMSPTAAGYGNPSQCPGGPELADLLK
jgi:hypothetical protein